MIAKAQNHFRVDDGMRVALSDDGIWQVQANGTNFDLVEVSDFFRAWLLLERPFSEVKLGMSVISDRAGSCPFPFGKLIASTMVATSNQWAERALPWVPLIGRGERIELYDLLKEAKDGKWGSQKLRQFAAKAVKEIERDR